MEKVIIYTDGACSGNPGPGGWGTILMYNGNKKEICEKEALKFWQTMFVPMKNFYGFLEEIYNLTQIHKVKFIKVKGHADNEFNNRCDEMARNAIKTL